MIAYLEGRLLDILNSGCVLLTEAGVGYEVFLSNYALANLPSKDEFISFYIVTVVREDALELYGFSDLDERKTFLLLTSISKVGAKTAIAILSVFRPDDLRRIVLEDNINMLTQVSGIGKKTAQHLFLELKYKLELGQVSLINLKDVSNITVLKDALTGLINLGYDENDSSLVLQEVLKKEPDLDVAAALRAGLKILGKRSRS